MNKITDKIVHREKLCQKKQSVLVEQALQGWQEWIEPGGDSRSWLYQAGMICQADRKPFTTTLA